MKYNYLNFRKEFNKICNKSFSPNYIIHEKRSTRMKKLAVMQDVFFIKSYIIMDLDGYSSNFIYDELYKFWDLDIDELEDYSKIANEINEKKIELTDQNIYNYLEYEKKYWDYLDETN